LEDAVSGTQNATLRARKYGRHTTEWNPHLSRDLVVAGGILHVSEAGGTASPVTVLDPSRKEEFHLLPSFLPDGRHFVYLRVAPGTPDNGGVYVGSIDAKVWVSKDVSAQFN